MISPHTPPGTKVICIKAFETTAAYVQKLTVGAVYTVGVIYENPFIPGEFAAMIVEGAKNHGYSLDQLAPVALPDCLTSLLDKTPILEDA
jgi:hypothetical protein